MPIYKVEWPEEVQDIEDKYEFKSVGMIKADNLQGAKDILLSVKLFDKGYDREEIEKVTFTELSGDFYFSFQLYAIPEDHADTGEMRLCSPSDKIYSSCCFLHNGTEVNGKMLEKLFGPVDKNWQPLGSLEVIEGGKQ